MRVMKAAAYRRFGDPEVVRVEDVPVPMPGPTDVQIRVHASTVSAADQRARSMKLPRGFRLLAAPALGLFRPRRRVLGMDVAGVVEAVGSDVTLFAVGDEVVSLLGFGYGGHAEFVCVPQDATVAKMPSTMTFEEAATLPFGGLTAWSFLDRVTLLPGTTVLVNGASGAVGTAMVQLAAHAGAHVTGICSGANVEMVKALGAHEVIDYTAQDFSAGTRMYDVIVDCVGNGSFERVHQLISPDGSLLLVITDLRGMLLSSWRARRSGKIIATRGSAITGSALRSLVELAEAGHFTAVCDRTYELTDIVAAHTYVDTGRKKGNVVIRVARGSA